MQISLPPDLVCACAVALGCSINLLARLGQKQQSTVVSRSFHTPGEIAYRVGNKLTHPQQRTYFILPFGSNFSAHFFPLLSFAVCKKVK